MNSTSAAVANSTSTALAQPTYESVECVGNDGRVWRNLGCGDIYCTADQPASLLVATEVEVDIERSEGVATRKRPPLAPD